MSRPFQDTFDRDQSPLTPLSAGGSTPISYQANLNRQKTKKWVDAKPGNYGGDDWGDEYDDGYEDPPPLPLPPVPKVTGFRQPGQSAKTGTGNKKSYGELPSLPTDAPDRSATNPLLLRKNSFSKDDDRRAFSNGPSHRQNSSVTTATITPTSTSTTSAGPPALHISTQPSVTGRRKAVPPPVIEAQSPLVEGGPSCAESNRSSAQTASDTRSAAGERYSQQGATSDLSSPLRTRALSPQARAGSPLGGTTSRSGSPAVTYAPRKSSLSQATAPDFSGTSSVAQEMKQDAPAPRPWAGPPRVASPGATATSPVTKALPFIRPSDIYKRLEEERQVERQSLDSGRPSMGAIMGRNSDTESSAGPGQASAPTISSPTEPATCGRRGSSSDRDDTSDSGRRLMPMLEPVQERKSEYGFDAMAAKSPEAAHQLLQETQKPEVPVQQYKTYEPESAYNIRQGTYDSGIPTQQYQGEAAPQQYAPHVEQVRRLSTSPKLPDLHRMSGFGIDLWPQSKPEVSEVPVNAPILEPEARQAEEEPSGLRKQPSLGFTSVVHQAFDRSDSVRETLSPSGVRRTDSESTSTTGISPIMSRVPSTTNPEYRGRGIEQNSTPAIAEEQEPNSRRGSGNGFSQQQIPQPAHKDEEPEQVPFHLGHRRDLSTPSPANSPARTPNLETFNTSSSGEEVHVAQDPQSAIIADPELQNPKPLPERNQSFRPALPGAWVSATDSESRSETPGTERSDAVSANRPIVDVAYQNNNFANMDDDDMDISPTTTKRPLPQSVFAAVFSGRQDKSTSNSALSTPDPALAPVGNPYASAVVDPRLSNEPKEQSQEIELQTPGLSETVMPLQPPAITENRFSAASSASPGSSPEDTPYLEEDPSKNDEYSTSPAPLKHKSPDEVTTEEKLATPILPTIVPIIIPALSTDASPMDDETDRLRKEIVRSLSPRGSMSSAPHGFVPPPSLVPTDETSLSLPSQSSNAPRDSMYLPSEYDNYWAETEEEEAPSQFQSQQQTGPVPLDTRHISATGPSPVIHEEAEDIPPTLPLYSPKRASRTSIGSVPAALERRFSWEGGSEAVKAEKAGSRAPTPTTGPFVSVSEPQPTYAENDRSGLQVGTPTRSDSASPAPLSVRSAHVSESHSDKPSEGNAPAGLAGKAAAIAAAVAATVTSVVSGSHESGETRETAHQALPSKEKALTDENGGTVEKSPSEEKEVSSSIPSNEEYSAKSSPQRIVSMLDANSIQPTPPSQGSPAQSFSSSQPYQSPQQSYVPRPQNPADLTKPRPFKEIMALGSAEQRIRAYNESRHQYAAMDSGLGEWVHATSMQQPASPPPFMRGPVQDEANARGSQTSRHGSQAPIQQPQPYYKQYLNASTPSAPAAAPSRLSAGMPTGTQGFGASTGKTTHQMQAKSKELLHSASIFGGKATKASKGLLAKGKSRFMGSGDKDSLNSTNESLPASPASQDKPKASRRASWAFPLSLHHSSGRPATINGDRLNTPPPGVARNSISHDRQHSMSSFMSRGHTPTPASRPATASPLPPGGHSNVREVGDRSTAACSASTPALHFLELNLSHSSLRDERWGSVSDSVEGGSLKDKSADSLVGEEGGAEGAVDGLAPPAPIGKYQPSWDPFNATPIAEEEGFGWDSPPKALRQRADTLPVRNAALDGPVNGHVAPGSVDEGKGLEERRQSGDWVLVAPVETHRNTGDFSPIPAEHLRPDHTRNLSEVSALTVQEPEKVANREQTLELFETQERSDAHTARNGASYEAGDGHESRDPNSENSRLGDPGVAPASIQQTVAATTLGNDKMKPEDQPKLYSLVSGTDSTLRADKHAPEQTRATDTLPGTGRPPSVSDQTLDTNNDADVSRELSEDQPGNQESSTPEFAALPPIRRSSTFDLNGKTKPSKERLSIADDDQDDSHDSHDSRVVSPISQSEAPSSLYEHGHALEASVVSAALVRVSTETPQPNMESARYSFEDESHEPEREVLSRPSLADGSDSERGVLKTDPTTPTPAAPHPPPSESLSGQNVVGQRSYVPPVVTDQQPHAQEQMPRGQQVQRGSMLPPAHQRHASLDEQQWAGSSSNSSQGQGLHASASGQSQRQRPLSMVGLSQPPKITPQYSEIRPPPSTRAGAPGLPPSSAQRYPELFQPQLEKDQRLDIDINVQPEYPVAEKGYLARQQATEYQIPGIGPPDDDPRNTSGGQSRRNSGFFKEIGGRLSRGSSRERAQSEYQVPGLGPPVDDPQNTSGSQSRRNSGILKELGGKLSRASSRERIQSRGEDDGARDARKHAELRDSMASSDGISLDDTGNSRRGRRSGMFGAMSFTSRDAPPGHPPPSQGSMINQPGSRVGTPTTPSSPLVPAGKKRSFFSSKSDSGPPEKKEEKPSILSRQSTGLLDRMGDREPEKAGKEKKHRFSALSHMFNARKGGAEKAKAGSIAQVPSWVPSALPGIMLLARNDYDRQVLEQHGLLRREPPRGQWGQLPGGQQQQQQQPLNIAARAHVGSNAAPGDTSNGMANSNAQASWVQSVLPGIMLMVRSDQEKQILGQEGLLSQRIAPAQSGQLRGGEQQQQQQQQQPPSTIAATPVGSGAGTGKGKANADAQESWVASVLPGIKLKVTSDQEMQVLGQAGLLNGFPPTQSGHGQLDPDATSSEEPVSRQREETDSVVSLNFATPVVSVPVSRQRSVHSLASSKFAIRPVHPAGHAATGVSRGPIVPSTMQLQAPAQVASSQQAPPALQKRTSDGPPPVAQKRPPPGSQSGNTQPESKSKRSGLFSSLLGGRRNSGLNEKAPPSPQGAPQSQNQQFDPRQQQLPPQNRGAISGNSQQQQQHLQQVYETPPIPGAYSLVRGEGQLAPTDYDPRGLNQQQPLRPLNQPPPRFADQRAYDEYMRQQAAWQAAHHPPQAYPPQPVYHLGQQPQPYIAPHSGQAPGPQGVVVPHAATPHTPAPNAPATQGSHRPAPFLGLNKALHGTLSTEDLVARSPARSQFGQQAPYQLALPPGDAEDDSPHARKMPAASPLRKDSLPPAPQAAVGQGQQPVPLPASAANDDADADDVPPPPPPKMPSYVPHRHGSHDSHSPSLFQTLTPPTPAPSRTPLNRSNTVTSAVSQLSRVSSAHAHTSSLGSLPAAVSPPTSHASPEMVSASPAAVPGMSGTLGSVPGPAAAAVAAAAQAARVMPDHEEKIYDDSREGLIVVEDANVRRVNGGRDEEEEDLLMSATSFPGDEWRPWGLEEGGGFE